MILLVKALQIQQNNINEINKECINIKIKEYNEIDHKTILDKTISVTKSFIFAGFTGDLQLSLVTGIWILFAQTLSGYNNTTIALIVLLQQILKLIMILLTSYLCDKYGFDKVVIVTSSCVLISTFLFSISMNIYFVIIAVIIESMAGSEVEVIGLAWISKMLPQKQAALYISLYIALTSIAYCLGVSLSGIISDFVHLTHNHYRNAFIFAFILASIRWIFILIKIRNKQKHLINQQMKLIQFYQNEDNSLLLNNNDKNDNNENEKLRFPICVDLMRHSKHSQSKNNINLNDKISKTNKKWFEYIFNSKDIENKSNWYWIELLLNIFQYSLVSTLNIVMVPWYLPYMKHRYNAPVVISGCQIGIGAFMISISCIFAEKLFGHISMMNKYYVLSICYIMRIITYIFGCNYNMYIFNNTTTTIYNLYWMYISIICIIAGIIDVVGSIILIELQPKADTSKISALRVAFRFMFGGIASSVVAAYQHNLWFIIAFLEGCGLSVICIIILSRISLLFVYNK